MMADTAETTSAPLESEIRRLIALAGPMPVSEFMGLCLGHPQHGYYITHDPIGATGDFTTSPEISQMFGELLGLWAAAAWRQMDSPATVQLIELGPGRATMMADMLRAANVMREFRQSLEVHLVETSPALIARQKQTLSNIDVALTWHDTLVDVPEGPAIIIANEFFDALPINQAVKQAGGWHERVIGVDAEGKLAFALAPEPLKFFEQTLPPQVRMAEVGSLYEWRSDTQALEVGRRVVRGGGAALIIDYGHVDSMVGDTFQALRGQRKADPLVAPGQSDVTAHVDFQALGNAAESIGARVHGPLDQATFLRRIGIEKRATNLKAVAPPDKAQGIETALARLTAGGAAGMGALFKAIGLSAPAIGSLPGFET
jgi:NADH dehydrogenase [ubiquinone] 1 alpha subcomplex assembly factor 7